MSRVVGKINMTTYSFRTVSSRLERLKIKLEKREKSVASAKRQSKAAQEKVERKKLGIRTLPANLGVALAELESDRDFLNRIFEDIVVDKIIELERKDQREISIRPHPHEFYLYFDV